MIMKNLKMFVKNLKSDAVTAPKRQRENGEFSRPDSGSTDGVRGSRMEITAYYKGQIRGFANSGELCDWLSAERQLDTESGDARVQ